MIRQNKRKGGLQSKVDSFLKGDNLRKRTAAKQQGQQDDVGEVLRMMSSL